VTCGIWRPVKLVTWSSARIESIQIIQNALSDSLAELTARIKMTSDYDLNIEAGVENPTNPNVPKSLRTRITKGNDTIDIHFSIKNPKRWWCNTMGAPYLYDYGFFIRDAKNKIDQSRVKFGLRTIELVQQKDASGSSFYFRLNGIPVFMKGANYIPPDNFLPRVTEKRS